MTAPTPENRPPSPAVKPQPKPKTDDEDADARLDEALEESFPASDAPSVDDPHLPKHPRPQGA